MSRWFTKRPRLSDYGGVSALQLVDQPAVYKEFSDDDLDEFVFLTLHANGRIAGGAPESLIDVCREWSSRVPVDKRVLLERALLAKIQSDETGTHALLPLMLGDRDTSLVSTTTLDWCCLGTDEHAGVVGAIEAFESGLAQNREGILLGVLATGDRRLLASVRHLRASLIRPEVKAICASNQAMLHAPLVEYLVDWLDEVPSGDEEGPFGAVAGFLFRLPQQHSVVIELERMFPARLGQRTTTEIGRWTIEQFGRRVAPRLRSIALQESDPKVMHLVMGAWGVGT